MGTSPDKQSEYNARYYEKKKQKIAEDKARRYREDPEYRAAALRRSKEAKEKAKEERRKNPSPPRRRGPLKPTEFMINVGGVDHQVTMYTTGQVAKALRRKTQTVRVWEMKGNFPEALYRSASNDRLYTEFQYKNIASIYRKLEKEYGAIMRTRINSTPFFSLVKELWEDYPLGVDPAE